MRFRPPPSARGCPPRARRARPERARRAPPCVRKRRIAIPATTSSWAALDAGGSGAGSSSASARSASSRRPIRSRRRTSRLRACAAFTRSPCASSVARAASSAFAGQPRSRETSAISASATTHLRAGHGLFRTEGARGTSQKRLRSNEIAELRHRDASKRERRRVVAQGDPVQGAERITCGERARRGCDQRVHRNPATLVTPAFRHPPCQVNLMTNNERSAAMKIALQPEGPEARPIRRYATTMIKSPENDRKERTARHAHATDRVAASMGGCAPATAREGEGPDARP